VRQRMDVGRINGEAFLNVAGVGFDAYMSAAFHDWTQPGRRRGILPYVWLGLGAVARFVPQRWRVEMAGETIELPAFLATFANGRQYGGGAVIAPEARLNDGQLEFVVIDPCTKAELLLNTPRLFLGSLTRFRRYRLWTVPGATLIAQYAADHHRDGELGERSERFEITLEPRALDVLVPRRTLEDPEGPFSACEAAAGRSASAEERHTGG
jgi:diacylglycerol kinase (ATP)